MPKQKQATQATIEELPDELWEKIGNYLDLNAKYQLQRVSRHMNDRIVYNCLATIRFEKAMQYQKFIDNKPSYRNQIRNLHLEADATDYIFPFPKDYKPSEFSFFSTLKKYFPAIKTITLEPKHFYMLSMLIDDPQFRCEDNYRLIKELTLKPIDPLLSLGSKANKLIKIKYEATIIPKNTDITLFNTGLTSQSLAIFEKFTALQSLSINLNSRFSIPHCDYEDIHHLLRSLPQLKTLDITVHYDLSYDPQQRHGLSKKEKEYPVNINKLTNYPNITSLILNGWIYWPESLLSHFPAIKKLVLNFSFSYILIYRNNVLASIDLSNRIIRLLGELRYPEKLVSLEIFASVPILAEVVAPSCRYQAFKLIPIHLAELTQFTHLQQLTLHQPNDLHLRITEDNHSPFIQAKASDQNKNYAFPSIQQLEIHYGTYNVYHPGDLTIIRSIFPHLKFLNLIKDAVDKDSGAKAIKDKSWTCINELNDLLNENPWQNIQISISGIDHSDQKKLSSHNVECVDNKFIIRPHSYSSKSTHAATGIEKIKATRSSQFFQPSSSKSCKSSKDLNSTESLTFN
jgi:hypothetical protein